jgi:hypothetical protein
MTTVITMMTTNTNTLMDPATRPVGLETLAA